jgi:rsbT antagonist protein RsbS
MERIPILRMGSVLLVTIQVDMQDQTAMALQEDLADKIAKTGANGVLIDISALEIVDSFVGRMLASISGIAASCRPPRWWWACSRRWPSPWSSSGCRSRA